jgi:uncharacterized protein (TIGR02147 family)
MAQHMGCQAGYLTQVLSDSAQLSLEQAYRLAGFVHLNDKECEYWLLLVQYARAASTELRQHFHEQILERQNQQSSIQHKVPERIEIPIEDVALYFSSWEFAAVHVLLTIPGFQKISTLSERLRIPESRTREILQFLVRVQLASAHPNGVFRTGKARMHLPEDSNLIRMHHSHWRLRALESFSHIEARDLHFSSVVSISRGDWVKLKSLWSELISSSLRTVRDSKEEHLVSFNVDLFEV